MCTFLQYLALVNDGTVVAVDYANNEDILNDPRVCHLRCQCVLNVEHATVVLSMRVWLLTPWVYLILSGLEPHL
jgi:hypothetical protein